HYQAAKRGEPRTVVIYGEPGIGKTRLATEFLKAAGLDGALCLKVERAPHDVRRPLGVFVDLVPKLLEAPGGLGVSPEGMELLQRLVGTHALPSDDPAVGEADFLRGRTWRAVEDLILAVCSEGTTVIAVDDAQWIDTHSVACIQELASSSRRVPIVVVLTARSAGSPKFEQPSDAVISLLRVRVLSKPASLALYGNCRAARGAPADEQTAERAVQRAKGNPLFLKSLALAVGAPESDDNLPADLQDLISREVATIEEPTNHVLLAAAILGPLSTPQRIASILDLRFRDLIRSLQVLEERGLLEPGPDATALVHPLVSDLLHLRVPATVLNSLHFRAAHCLETDGRETRDTSLRWAATEHLVRCGEPARATGLVLDLAQNALTIGQPKTACDLLTKVERICPDHQKVDFYSSLAVAASAAEDAELTRREVIRHRAAAGQADLHDSLEFLDLEAARLTDEPIGARIARLEQCLRSLRATSEHRTHAAHLLMIAFEMTLDTERAHKLYDELSRSPLFVSTSRERARLFHLSYHTFAGNVDLALAEARTILNLPAESTPSNVRRRLLAYAGATLFRGGACADACAAHRESFTIAEQFGMTSSALYDAASLAWMYWILESEGEWLYWSDVSDRLYQSTPKHSRTSLYLSNRIEFAIARGLAAEARAWLDLARAEYPEIVTPRSKAVELAFACRIDLMTGREPDDGTLALLGQLHETGKSTGLHDPVAECYWHALVSAGHHGMAEDMIRHYVQTHRRDRFPFRTPTITPQ
ncbi:MAG: AAA family ATPase, partial [Gemmatimonadota bacterium]|nr:AAA family ATPase [Gemmatimonadota bacterium]